MSSILTHLFNFTINSFTKPTCLLFVVYNFISLALDVDKPLQLMPCVPSSLESLPVIFREFMMRFFLSGYT